MKKKPKYEAVLWSFMILLLGAVVLAQLFLVRPDTRPIFTGADRYEGSPGLGTKKKMAVITLESDRPEPGVFLVVNGARKQSFLNKMVTVQVAEHSLIEISAEGVNHPVAVSVTGISEFVNRKNLNMKCGGEDNIFLIGRILFH